MEIIWIILVLEDIILFTTVINVFKYNPHGHSSINPYWLIPVFLFLFLIALIITKFRERSLGYVPFTLSAVNFVFGVLLPFFLVELKILQAKSDWIHSGMPSPPEWKDLFLGGFCLIYVIVVMIILMMDRRQA